MCIVGRERKLFAELSDVCLSLQEALVRIDYNFILQLAKQQLVIFSGFCYVMLFHFGVAIVTMLQPVKHRWPCICYC